MSERKKAFKNDSFLKKKEVIALQEEHKKAFGTDINDLGYPDMGSGLYSALIPYENWVTFNNVQRAHYNMVESSGPVLAMIVFGGLFQPKICTGLGLLYSLGRILYSTGYTSKAGANGRITGAVIGAVSSLGLVVLSFFYGVKSTGLI